MVIVTGFVVSIGSFAFLTTWLVRESDRSGSTP